MKTNTKVILNVILVFLLFPKPAYAYIDPGTGSYLFQLLIAGFLGGTFFLKTAIKKIKGFFNGTPLKENNDKR